MRRLTQRPEQGREERFAEFLRLARQGERGPEFQGCLESIFPSIEAAVRGICDAWAPLPDPSTTPEDVVQEVMKRLQHSPPTHEPRLSPRATILKWAKTTAGRYLSDLHRRRASRLVDGEEIDNRPQIPLSSDGGEGKTSLEAKMLARDELKKFFAFLRKQYPTGAKYLAAWASNPNCTRGELAKILGTSRQNVDQIHSRTRKWLVRFRERNAS